MGVAILAHHLAVTFLGKVYEPHGIVEHAVVFAGAALFLALAVIGAMTVFRWIGSRFKVAALRGTQ